jgi:2-polyprenyl-3-methyl-5-hydroxy-6-metoxy-1,4-benzoquinol methylase
MFAPKAACANQGFCHGHGACFLGTCFCGGGYTGDSCQTRDEATPPCSSKSDKCFIHPKNGRSRISLERWSRAQAGEESWWTDKARQGETHDKADHTLKLFEQYKDLPSELGNVAELGCGPFTQLKSIIGVKGRDWQVGTVTLVDPIMVVESKHAHSSYTTGRFTVDKTVYPTKLHQIGAEEAGSLFPERFDTVIMQNVLEHVTDAYEVLESLYNITKVGGVVLLWEPVYNEDWTGWQGLGQELILDTTLPIKVDVADVDWTQQSNLDNVRSRDFSNIAHPIRSTKRVFEHFMSKFEPITKKYVPGRLGDSSIVFIGRKL